MKAILQSTWETAIQRLKITWGEAPINRDFAKLNKLRHYTYYQPHLGGKVGLPDKMWLVLGLSTQRILDEARRLFRPGVQIKQEKFELDKF